MLSVHGISLSGLWKKWCTTSLTKKSYDIPRAVWLEETKLGDAVEAVGGCVFDLTVVGVAK